MSDNPGQIYPGDPVEPLRRRNQRILARDWPAGALETCHRLEDEYGPGWHVSWLPENTYKGWERPAGWLADSLEHSLVGGDDLRRQPEDGVSRSVRVFAETPAELGRKVAAVMERVAEERERQEAAWRAIRRR